jgi:ABC-type nitrate/sulfonate/bicarbonate transport system substrate-binding protein
MSEGAKMDRSSGMSRRQFLSRGGKLAAGTTIALTASGLLAACGSSSKSTSAATTTGAASTGTGSTPTTAATKSLEKVTFQLGWLKLAQFGGHFVALKNGYFADEGIDAEFLSGGSGIDGLTLVENGQVMMADANGSDILTAVSKNIPLQCFGTIYQSTPNALMSLGKDPLTTMASLKGKTVGLPNGEQQLLTAMLKRAGVDPSTVKLVVVGTDPSVLTSGQVDAYIGYGTEQGLDLQQSGVDVKIVYFDKLGDPDYGNAYFAKTSFLEKNTDLVTRWMKADLRGWQEFVKDPAAAATLTWDLYHTQTQAVLTSEKLSAKASVPLINGGAAATHGLLWVDQSSFQEVYELYKTAGVITGNVDLASVYTQKFLVGAGDTV